MSGVLLNPPNPGSDLAMTAGCRCPVIDNHRGAGAYVLNGKPQFWINWDCPLHGKATPVPSPGATE